MFGFIGSLVRSRLSGPGLLRPQASLMIPGSSWRFEQRCEFSKVRTLSNPRKRFLIKYQEARLEGRDFDLNRRYGDDNRFYKVINGMKVFKPITNGLRNRRVPTRFHLYKGRCVHRLSYPRVDCGGRSHITGRVTTRHRGGGHKRRHRFVDFYRMEPGPKEVVRLEYDPNRSSELALLKHKWTNEYSYILRPKNLNVGDVVESFLNGVPEFGIFSDSPLLKETLLRPGNCFRLKDIPPGSNVHCVGLVENGSAVLCRSAGNSAKIIDHRDGETIMQMPSKETRKICSEACATYGVVGNELHGSRSLGKAGINRNRGIRPCVRGVAMNACDHPHGGGRGNKKNMQAKSVYGKTVRGIKTVRRWKDYLVISRRRYKLMNPGKTKKK